MKKKYIEKILKELLSNLIYIMAFRMALRAARTASRFIRRGKAFRPLYKAFTRRRKTKTQNKIHSFIRLCDKDTLYPGANGPNTITELGVNQHLAYSFKLDNVVNPADFTNLYDQYKINKITLMLEPTFDQTSSTSPPLYARKIRVVHDYNDNNILSDEDDYLEYSNCKSYSPFTKSGIRITLFPKLNNILQNVGGAANAFNSVNSTKVWLNIDSDEVPHFGIKIFIPGGLTTGEGAVMFRVRAKYHLSLKNSK